MKKKIVSFLLAFFCALGVVAGCGNTTASSSTESNNENAALTVSETAEKIDYAGQATLDLDADSQTIEVTVKTFIDGDTTHFNAEGFNADNLLKARYAAVNTPESTGKLEEWGKAAARFTRTTEPSLRRSAQLKKSSPNTSSYIEKSSLTILSKSGIFIFAPKRSTNR